MPRLLTIIASTRPGRVGLPVGTWFAERAAADGTWEVDCVDLAELDLPMLDEPKHPMLQQYEHDHTREWSERVAAADAVVWIMPEYNHSFSAPLKNAIDYLHREWQGKPVGWVSYGGVSGGIRAVQALKPVLVALGMHPVPVGVPVPFVHSMVEDGRFVPTEPVEQGTAAMLGQLARLHEVVTALDEAEAG